MKIIFDNARSINRADDRHILEEDEDGLLYETNNAFTRALVCSAMFVNWLPERDTLAEHFGSEEVAGRYLSAAQDFDK